MPPQIARKDKIKKKMEKLLQNALAEGETLLWKGRPEPFEPMDKTYKDKIIKSTIKAFVIAIILTVAYILTARYCEVKASAVLIFVFYLCAFCVPYNNYKDVRDLRKKVIYAITDERMITVVDSAKSVDYCHVPEVTFRTDEDGHVSLLCGHDAMNSEPTNWRFASVSGVVMDESNDFCESYVMYNIPEVDKVKDILSKYVKVV